MTTERTLSGVGHGLEVRAAKHAALSDLVRLAVVDVLMTGDASPTELQARLGVPSNLLAHHVNVLESAGIVTRRRSQGDRRRSYVTLVPGGMDAIVPTSPSHALGVPAHSVRRVVFVCTANSARSQLASALWQEASDLPASSAGTAPASEIAPGAVAAARRHHLRLVGGLPRHLRDVARDGDLLVTVCDNAHEELGGRDAIHWAVPDPVPSGTDAAFDEVVVDLRSRIAALAASTAPLQQNP